MSDHYDIIGFGICAVDFIGLVERYPGPGEKAPLQAFSKQGGGNTGTALTAATRLGAKTAYLGKLGLDEYSLFLLDEFQKQGVGTRHVIFEKQAQPPVSFIHVDKHSGEKRISRYWQEFKIAPQELNRSVIQNSRLLFLDHYYTEAGLAAARWIKESDGTVVVDAERFTPGFDEILKTADYVIASHKFTLQQTGDNDPQGGAKSLQKKYGNIVVVTAGEKGAFCETQEESFHQPAFSVNVVDTTGAGDVFHGAFMIGLLENWPLRKTVEFSAAAAALKCRGLGGRAMIPTRQEALSFLNFKGNYKFWQ